MDKFKSIFSKEKEENNNNSNNNNNNNNNNNVATTPKGEEPDEIDKNQYNCEVLDQQNQSLLWALLKQVKIGEIRHLQLPIFVLQPRSLLEKLTDNFAHQHLLLNLPQEQDALQRFLGVIRFYLSSWHIRPKGVKNPLNPVIGEIHNCFWKFPNGNADSISTYVAEQLSHHPPHTAFCYYNVERGIAANANLAPSYVKYYGNSAESKINGKIHVCMKGKYGTEEYSLDYPDLLVKGILFGTLMMEIIGKVTIKNEANALFCDIEFKQKGMFTGEYNLISGKIKKKTGKLTSTDLYLVEGYWDGIIKIIDCKTKAASVLFDPSQEGDWPPSFPPLEEEPQNSSRILWKDVVQGIRNNDEDFALDAKRKIEAVQRKEENDRIENKREWIPSLFKKDKNGYFWYKDWDEIIQKMDKHKDDERINVLNPKLEK